MFENPVPNTAADVSDWLGKPKRFCGRKTSRTHFVADVNRLDFQTWTQTNLDKPERKRSFRVVWLLPSMVEAAHTGQISDFIHDG